MAKTNKKALSVLGKTFGLWEVKSIFPEKFDYLECECKCGQKGIVNVYSLTSGKSKSCGCGTKQFILQTIKERNPNG